MSDKYYRLVTFVINICPKPLRELFIDKAKKDEHLKYKDLTDYLVFRRQDIYQLQRRNKISLDQIQNILPANGIVDIQTWDVTLLSVLLKGLFKTILDNDERNCLDTITDIRNYLQHISGTECIGNEKFESSWSVLTDAVMTLSKCAGATDQCTIAEEINKALTESMPTLGDVLRTWHKDLCVQLYLQNKELQKTLEDQATELQTLKSESRTSKTILTKGSVKRKGRSGIAEKRFKVVDNKVESMKEKFQRALSKPSSGIESYKDDISLIAKQLNDNHRVIVTGHDNELNYKCALAAIKERNYQNLEQCLEINNPSDWKRICSDDAQLALFIEPFGRSAFDERKYNVMLNEFETMLDDTHEDDDHRIDIVIVTNQRFLDEAISRSEHEMLCASCIVNIDSGYIGYSYEGKLVVEDTVHRNLLDMSKTFKKTYKLKPVDRESTDKAKQIFLEHSMLVITGSKGSGKTSLALNLLSSYDLSKGDENFLVITDPGELKYIKLSLNPVIIIRLFCGLKFDHAKAMEWYNQFDRLFAAVRENQIAVITTIESKVHRMISATMLQHPVLKHVIRLPGGLTKESEDSNGDTNDCGVQTDVTSLEVLPKGNNSPDDTKVDEHHLRSVIGVRDHVIEHYSPKNKCVITDAAILPSGDILLADRDNRMLLKVNDRYNVISTLQLDVELYSVCYIGNNNAVLCSSYQMMFVDVRDDMSVTRSLNISHSCLALTYHSNKLYVIDEVSVRVYSTAGEHLKVLQTEETKYLRNIAVSHDGSIIYLSTATSKLITIDDSGKHLFTLDFPVSFDTMIIIWICLDDRGFLFILCAYIGSSNEKIIIQISPDGRKCYGTLFQLENNNSNSIIKFDSNKSALVLAGESNKVLTLR